MFAFEAGRVTLRALFIDRKKSQSHHSGIIAKVLVGGKNCPSSPLSSGADQEVNGRTRNASPATLIAHERCIFVIFHRERRFVKGSKGLAQLCELSLLANPGE